MDGEKNIELVVFRCVQCGYSRKVRISGISLALALGMECSACHSAMKEQVEDQ